MEFGWIIISINNGNKCRLRFDFVQFSLTSCKTSGKLSKIVPLHCTGLYFWLENVGYAVQRFLVVVDLASLYLNST